VKIQSFKYFYPERPTLIHIDQPLVDAMSRDKNCVAEKKLNGNRLQLHATGKTFDFWDRHEKKMSYVPDDDLMDALMSLELSGYNLFDGELRHNKTKGVRHKIMLYDVFIWHDELLIGKPFWYRRNILKDLLNSDAEPLGIAKQYHTDFREVFHEVIQDDEVEGLVIKNCQGKLALGRRAAIDSTWMWKIRKPNNSYRF